MFEDGSKNTVRFLTIDNSGHDIFSVNSVSCCLGIPDHLKDIYQRNVKGMSEEQCSQETNLLVEYQDIFARNDMDLGLFTGDIKHRIDTGNSKPVRHNLRRTPFKF
jgi:hypothetical protein